MIGAARLIIRLSITQQPEIKNMTTLHVYVNKQHVAMIALPPKAADAYVPEEPWCLLHDTGRIDRFEKQAQAKEEAMKSYGNASFSRKDLP